MGEILRSLEDFRDFLVDDLRLYLTTSLVGRLVSGVTLKEACGMFTLQVEMFVEPFLDEYIQR